MAETIFFEYELLPPENGIALICIGERVKKGTFRPCIETLPFSTISGALRRYYGRDDVNAVGFFDGPLTKTRIENSANNREAGVADLQLTTEVLVNPRGKVYVVAKSEDIDLLDTLGADETIALCLGALKSKGFGRCRLRRISVRRVTDPEGEKRFGELRTRIPEENAELFGIRSQDVIKPVYGYLFKPTSITDGEYVRALFDGSMVRGYEFLLRGLG
jgi:hypothetical protein